MSQPSDLLVDTRVEADPERPSRLSATIPTAWNVLYVFGGITMATAVNAARASLSQPSFEPLSANATFLSPVRAGRVSLDVRALRKGKGSEQFAVDLYEQHNDTPSLHVVTTFGPQRDSEANFVDVSFPDVPLPSLIEPHVPRAGSSMLMLPYYHNIETRVAKPTTPTQDGKAHWYGWHRFKKAPRLADGSIDPLAYVPACDMIGPALRVARGREAKPLMVVSLDINLHFYARTDSEWLLQDARIYQAADGYVSGIVHLWDEHKRLVGHSLQRAVLRSQAF